MNRRQVAICQPPLLIAVPIPQRRVHANFRILNGAFLPNIHHFAIHHALELHQTTTERRLFLMGDPQCHSHHPQ